MESAIAKKPIQTVSFDTGANKSTLSVRLVLELIKDSLENKKPITIEDIRMAYARYAMTVKRCGTGEYYSREKGKYVFCKTIDEWYSRYAYKEKAINWFRGNLGSAILKGKLMVIPVIDLE